MSEFQDLLKRLQALPPDELSQVLRGAPEKAAALLQAAASVSRQSEAPPAAGDVQEITSRWPGKSQPQLWQTQLPKRQCHSSGKLSMTCSTTKTTPLYNLTRREVREKLEVLGVVVIYPKP